MVAAINSVVTVGAWLEKKRPVGEAPTVARVRDRPGGAAKAQKKDVKNERTNALCPLESTKVQKNEPKRTPNEPITNPIKGSNEPRLTLVRLGQRPQNPGSPPTH